MKNIEIPAIGQTFSRDLMPQIGPESIEKFKSYLHNHNIKAQKRSFPPKALKATQSEFDNDKIFGMMMSGKKTPIVVSNDMHVADGHHRWLAAHNSGEQKIDALHVDLPILDLIKKAKDFNNGTVNEEVTHKDFGPMMDSFVSFAAEKLGLLDAPKVNYKSHEDQGDQPSFGGYNPHTKEIVVATKNRHPMDVLRTLAHELVHHKQNEEGRIKDVAQEGSTGSPIEDEANYMAGRLMRWFAKANPNTFSLSHIIESNLSIDDKLEIFLENTDARTNTFKRDFGTDSLVQLYLDDTPGQRIENGVKENIDDQFASFFNEGVNDPGIMKAIFMGGGPGSGKDYIMNKIVPKELRDGEINPDHAFEFLMKKHKLDMEMPASETEPREKVRKRAKEVISQRERLALMGRKGLVINSTADDHEHIAALKQKLESLGYATKMLFVHTDDEVSKNRNVLRGKLGGRKVPDGTDKNGVPDGSPDIRKQKWIDAQKAKKELSKIFGDDYHEIDNSPDASKLPPEEKKKIDDKHMELWKTFKKFTVAPHNNDKAKAWVQAQISREKLKTRSYSFGDPRHLDMIVNPNAVLMSHPEAKRQGLVYLGFGKYAKPTSDGKLTPTHMHFNNKIVRLKEDVSKKKKVFKRKALNQEQKAGLDGYIPRDYIPADGIGPEYPIGKTPAIMSGIAGVVNEVKSFKKIRESWDAIAKRDMGTVPYSHAAVDEDSELKAPVTKTKRRKSVITKFNK